MTNKSKAKGTAAETKVVKYLKAHGIEAKRKALTGNKDEGDIQVKTNVTLEIKTGKMTACYNRSQLNEWLHQSKIEGINCDQPCYLVIVRYNRQIKDAEVWWHDGHSNEYHMQYLDDFCKTLQYLDS